MDSRNRAQDPDLDIPSLLTLVYFLLVLALFLMVLATEPKTSAQPSKDSALTSFTNRIKRLWRGVRGGL